ncbi:MAG: DUF4157 domain-containing protein [Myxococcota bacterium]
MPHDLMKRGKRDGLERSVPQTDASAAAVQLKRELAGRSFDEAAQLLQPGQGDDAQALARAGTQSGGGSLPHQARIQAAFGRHDIGAVQAHVGGEAKAASESLGASAYASGSRVAFAGAPDLHTAAHEAAHVVQQRGPKAPGAGLGAAGDRYEQHADAVADAVVQGKSAAPLLDAYAGPEARSAAPAEGGAVQRYSTGNAYKPKPKEGEDLFTRHDENPSVAEDSLQGVEYKVSHDAPQDLDVSDDKNMAIQPAGQVQEFFAKSGLVDGWNKQLAGGGTQIQLAEQDGGVKVAGETLKQVKPTYDGEALTRLVFNECLHFANIVLGRKFDTTGYKAIFENAETQDTKTTELDSNDVNDTARHLMGKSNDVGDIREKGKGKDKYVGKDYGKKLGKGKLDERAKQLGVNQYANPEVGEAYVTYSVRSDKKGTKGGETDYTGRDDKKKQPKKKSQPKPKKNEIQKLGKQAFEEKSSKKGAWDMHYAGVVAKSGADRVTLEDYNRNEEISLLHDQVREALKVQYAKDLEGVDLLNTPGVLISTLQMKLHNLDFGVAKDLANKALKGGDGGTWYFKMFGPHVGQSFHEREHQAGDTVNPLTLRLGRRDTDTKATEEIEKQRLAKQRLRAQEKGLTNTKKVKDLKSLVPKGELKDEDEKKPAKKNIERRPKVLEKSNKSSDLKKKLEHK